MGDIRGGKVVEPDRDPVPTTGVLPELAAINRGGASPQVHATAIDQGFITGDSGHGYLGVLIHQNYPATKIDGPILFDQTGADRAAGPFSADATAVPTGNIVLQNAGQKCQTPIRPPVRATSERGGVITKDGVAEHSVPRKVAEHATSGVRGVVAH